MGLLLNCSYGDVVKWVLKREKFLPSPSRQLLCTLVLLYRSCSPLSRTREDPNTDYFFIPFDWNGLRESLAAKITQKEILKNVLALYILILTGCTAALDRGVPTSLMTGTGGEMEQRSLCMQGLAYVGKHFSEV